MNKEQKEELYIERAKKLKAALPKPDARVRVRVRDAMEILHCASESVALFYLKKMVDMGLLQTEKRGTATEYFFVEKQDAETSAENTA